jgi:Tol biopolymer transport system component
MGSRDRRRSRVWLLVAAVAAAAAAPRAQPATGPRPQVVSPFPSGLTGTLVFESDAGGRPAIYTLALQTGAIAPLAGNPDSTSRTPRWSPDGRRVVFSSNRAHYEGAQPEQGTPDLDLWVVNADGSGLERLTTDPANENDPAWSPDGAAIVFSSDRESRGDLYQLAVATKAVTRLTRHFVGRAIMPAPSAGPPRIAFAAQTLRVGAFWDYQIHVRQADGTTTPVASPAGACWPRWSPDGQRMAHVRLNPNTPSVLEVRTGPGLQSTGVLTTPGLWSYYPAWSPDQSRLVYSVSPAHHEGEDWDLAVIDVATGTWQRLTHGRGNDRLPDWKP